MEESFVYVFLVFGMNEFDCVPAYKFFGVNSKYPGGTVTHKGVISLQVQETNKVCSFMHFRGEKSIATPG